MEERGGERNDFNNKNEVSEGTPLHQQEIYVGEELKIAVKVAIDRFRHNENEKELEFPSSLTANERAYVHRYCKGFGLLSKSRGKGNKRSLTVYKNEEKKAASKSRFSMTRQSVNAISNLLNNFPVTSRERHELSGQKLHKGIVNDPMKLISKENRLTGSNNNIVPPEHKETEYSKNAKRLPVYDFKDEILSTIQNNQVVFIAGETGSGKSTQVPQFILENCREKEKTCYVICSQPRRLSAISVSERVAAERGERIGQAVGYQVRLDGKLSSKTILQYCTTGVLLRLLMAGHKSLSNISHIIVDEIHERDAFIDYLLISLRDLLKSYKKLKLILMSAALNVELFKSYFGDCPVLTVTGFGYNVHTYFLEDVLKQTGYSNKAMKKLMAESDKELFQLSEDVIDEDQSASKEYADSFEIKEESSETKSNIESLDDCDVEIESESEEISEKGETSTEKEEEREEEKEEKEAAEDTNSEEPLKLEDEEKQSVGDEDDYEDEEQRTDIEVSNEMDYSLAQAWLNGEDESFDQIVHLVLNENVSVDYQHTDTKMTAVIVAAARGNLPLTEQLVELGANLEMREPNNDMDALEWAKHFNQDHVADYLQNLLQSRQSEEGDEHRRIQLYHKSFDDHNADINLIFALITHIVNKPNALQGAILIFLPGFDEIITLRDRLIESSEFSSRSMYQIHMLHSLISPASQKKVFHKAPKGCRKIILSTNIAETSVTIDDVVYVIDSGKVKEKSHDSISSVSMLRTVWISKASATQRKGRAGRCANGVCYHLFSEERYHHLQEYQDAEIQRGPIHSICLQTKMLAPANVSISEYLARAPEPPSPLLIRNSLRHLKSISALDENEEMTELGKILVQLPIEPQLGKMILMGMTLKCLEPSIIIACCCSYKDVFVLPTIASRKSVAATVKSRLSADSFSDHISMLRAFQGWQHAKRAGREKSYCSKNFLSPGVMEMVSGMRRQMTMYLQNMGFLRSRRPDDIRDMNQNSRNWAVIKAVVGAGMYPHIMQVDRENLVLLSEREKKVNIHNTSVVLSQTKPTISRAKKMKATISRLPFDWLAYEEMSRLYYSVQIKNLSILSPIAVALMCGKCSTYEHSSLRLTANNDRKGGRYSQERAKDVFFQESDSEHEEEQSEGEEGATFRIDDWIAFSGDDRTLYAVAMLRIKFLSLFSKRIAVPSKQWSEVDDHVVQCIVSILTKEEQNVGVTNPSTKDVERLMNKRSDRYFYGGGYDMSRGGGRHAPSRGDWRRKNQLSEAKEGASSGGKKTRQTSYFIMKCNNEKNMSIAFQRSFWATTRGNEKRLNRAFHDSEEVVLIFSIQGSGHFQGVAKMTSEISERRCEEFGSLNLGGLFDIEWLHQEEIAFQCTQHLCNPWNDNKKVQISRDAQELETGVGRALVQMWAPTDDLQPPQAPDHEVSRDTVTSPTESVGEESFYSNEMYNEGDQYIEGYPVYSPPPFGPHYMNEYVTPPHPYSMQYYPPQQVYAPPPNMYRGDPYYVPHYPPARGREQQEYYRDQYPRNNYARPLRGGYRF